MNWETVTAFLISFTIFYRIQNGVHARRRWNVTPSASVEMKPVLGMPSQNITVSLGERAELRCRVNHLGTKTVIWRKENNLHPLTIGLSTFVSDPRLSVYYNHRTKEWSLIIQEVQWSDEGLYHCQISTKEALDVNSVEITLSVQNIHVSGTAHVDCGSPIRLVCNATEQTDAPHNVDWYKDGNRVHSDADQGIIITKKILTNALVSVLVITSSKMSDAGVYLCRSSNRHIATLTVHILNVAAAVEKRDTNVDPMSNSRPRNGFNILLLSLPIVNCLEHFLYS